ncbi:hypothetical protein [Streptomyces sp. CBMA123]|uniref:hypothetical protein n=1 Tax=Streptomyces sp. CBMA123 TaxID=1896313 RepID=UPI001661E7DF|nr:hypothetical protein [Streptomyces sp. CBMA123]MBD0695447.1 hypothetical protein [Streptomyces sp. CBMA123]
MSPDSDYWERWIAPLLAFLAADTPDQITWSGKHRVRAAAVAEEIEFSLHLAEGMSDRGTLEPAALQDLRTIGRLCGEVAHRGHVGRWEDAVHVDPAWDEIRALARRILIDRLGTWSRPLPSRVLPQRDDD